MIPRHLIHAAVLTIAIFAAPPCLAGVELFPADGVKAWADVRVVSSDGERSWLDGGLGKTRFGGDDDGAHLAQAALLWQPRLADTVSVYVIGQYVPDAHEPLGIEEAFVRWKPVPTSGLRYSLRAGQFFVPVSLEHDGAGWTTLRTITPSAINSWIAEEVLVQGLEVTVQADLAGHGLTARAGGFRGNDTSATILTWRGWSLHDIASSHNTGLPLPDGSQGWSTILGGGGQSPFSEPVAEVDDRLGAYLRLDWQPPSNWAINLELYNNHGDPSVFVDGQWGWATRFWNLGIQYQPSQSWEILGQYMTGDTAMGWPVGGGRWAFDVAYDSAYVLATRQMTGESRLTGRLDYFAVKDRSWQLQDNNTEKGYAATLAWMKPLSDHLDLALEVLHVRSLRPARLAQGLEPRKAQTQAQMALRFHL